ncbi:TetR/AcrR family transcriptional regulator [Cryptosporangium minutisporangium]|uniref:TetR/AcrR family transcriptional regulator n=2 Tax=Cryptosporangium minutisporangium TaxID=113569 RepID=A0ABP6SY21_9ACTN
MIRAAVELFRERGYAGTSFGDVIERSGAPRGSIYHHFPGGKVQLAEEALRWYAQRSTEALSRLTGGFPADEAVALFLDASQDALRRSEFGQGCPVAGVALDLAPSDTTLATASTETFTAWQSVLAAAFTRDGAAPSRAARAATLVVAAVEGGLLLARAARSTNPLDDVRSELAGYVRAVLGHPA